MTRLQRTLLTALILFGGGVGAGIYVLTTDVRDPESRRTDEITSERLFPEEFGIAHVRSGRLLTRGTTIAFSRESGTDPARPSWRLTSPVDWPADDAAITDAINQMVAVRIVPDTRVDQPDQVQLEQWGLLRPRVSLTLETDKGAYQLAVGPRNGIQDLYPITDGAHRRAGLARPDFYWALDKPLADFRDRRVFPMEEGAVVSVKSHAFLLERSREAGEAGEEFTVADPDGAHRERADRDRAQIFLAALTKRLRIGRFLTDAFTEADAAQYGLDRANLLELRSKDGAVVGARVGKIYETGDQKGTAVMHLLGGKTVIEVPSFIDEEIAKTKADLQDRTLLRFERKKVAKLEIRQGGAPIVAERNGDAWHMTAPEKGPAQDWRLDALLVVFGKLKVERFLTEKASPAELREWFLEPPSRQLLFYDAEGRTLGEVRIGKRHAEGELYAMNGTEPRVAVLKESRIQALPSDARELIDRNR